ncbi:hypothetical protein F4809DRAFT_623954 [Biscogniauxia mediterranea]|nr:hypothetical protein F4809DRAFT_623954 [Biscogniauxia mediterranea]
MVGRSYRHRALMVGAVTYTLAAYSSYSGCCWWSWCGWGWCWRARGTASTRCSFLWADMLYRVVAVGVGWVRGRVQVGRLL